MYLKDKKQRITLRLNKSQFDCVAESSATLGISPSDFIRMLVNSYMFSTKRAMDSVAETTMKAMDDLTHQVVDIIEKKGLEKEVLGRENDKTAKHDIV
jgi:uncharacterized protein (DUF1778 family)